VVALGLFAFCILPIVGLIPVGMGAARSVAQEAQAASLAEAFFGAWQVRPAGASKFPIPGMFTNPAIPLTKDSNSMYFAGDGTQLSNPNGASMRLIYNIETNTAAATITLDFVWPPGGGAAAQKRYFIRRISL
jgi:hypothetical protein